MPEDPRLEQVARELQKTRWASSVVDSGWRLVWVSTELKALLGDEDDQKLGYGLPLFEVYAREPWFSIVTDDARVKIAHDFLPRIKFDIQNDYELPEGFSPLLASMVEQIDPIPPDALWASQIEFLQKDLPPAKINFIAMRLHDKEGEFFGTAMIYHSALPARILALVARGDESAFARMARLFDPGRRSASILFADVEASGVLSRRLPSAVYFRLVRDLISAIDEVVVESKGIVGKHAGDGVTAFFLADDTGSPSRAARAAMEAAKGMQEAARGVVGEIADETGLIEPGDYLVNVGIHWGGTLFMGQLITGGRLEITALGDEVNECARIQQSASGGQILASKSLIERLSYDDAQALGLDPDSVLYKTIAELPNADEKAVRDAGSIPITNL